MIRHNESGCMCSFVIRHTRIPIIIMGLTIGEIGGFSSKLPLLLDTTIKRWAAPPSIINGIMEKECANLRSS